MKILINNIQIDTDYLDNWSIAFKYDYDELVVSCRPQSEILNIVNIKNPKISIKIFDDNDKLMIDYISDEILYCGVRTDTNGNICKTFKLAGAILNNLNLENARPKKEVFNKDFKLFINNKRVEYTSLVINYRTKPTSFDNLELHGNLTEFVNLNTKSIILKLYNINDQCIFSYKIEQINKIDNSILESFGDLQM